MDKSEDGISTNQAKKIYSCSNSLYKAMKYLQEGGIILKHKKEKTNRNLYFLTNLGIVLATILLKLPEVEDLYANST